MFYILESDNQIDRLLSYKDEKTYIEVISSNHNYHPILSYTVAVYIRPISESQGFIIPINHDEGLNVNKQRICDIINQFTSLYTWDKKELMYHLHTKSVSDIQLLYSMVNYDRLDLPKINSTYNWYYSKFSDFPDTGTIVPLTKIFQKCEENYNHIQPIMHYEIPSGYDFYNNTATAVFLMIERQGLRVTYQEFIELFKPQNKLYSIDNNIVYSYYNLYNNTSRPTNAFNSINFAAIPKAPEYRKAIIPQNDYFVEYDFDGYHLRLLCEQIGYELTDESAHKQLARLYFNKDEITEDEYDKAKQINFHAIYGKIPPEYAFLEVFDKIQTYISQLWSQFEKQGYIQDPISGKQFTNKLPDMHPAKLMNYLMQSLETSKNISILKELIVYLKDKRSKVCLYVYDAIVIDFCKEDGKQTLEQIEKILNPNNKYPVKFKYSKNLVF